MSKAHTECWRRRGTGGIMLRTLSQKFDTYWVQSDQMDQIKDSFAQVRGKVQESACRKSHDHPCSVGD